MVLTESKTTKDNVIITSDNSSYKLFLDKLKEKLIIYNAQKNTKIN